MFEDFTDWAYRLVTEKGYLHSRNEAGDILYTKDFESAALFNAENALAVQRMFPNCAILDSKQNLCLLSEVRDAFNQARR